MTQFLKGASLVSPFPPLCSSPPPLPFSYPPSIFSCPSHSSSSSFVISLPLYHSLTSSLPALVLLTSCPFISPPPPALPCPQPRVSSLSLRLIHVKTLSAHQTNTLIKVFPSLITLLNQTQVKRKDVRAILPDAASYQQLITCYLYLQLFKSPEEA